MDYMLFGMQGSGKGTQGQILAEKKNLTIFETGSFLRKLSGKESELGKKVKSIIESGNLVPTEVVMEIIEDFMKQLPEGSEVLFDGIPRKKDQADSFDALMQRLDRDFLGIYIEISEVEAFQRLSSRRICSICKTVYSAFYTKDICEKCGGTLIKRSDDTENAIRTRIENYYKETLPVIEKYRNRNKMITINGEQSIENVTDEILMRLAEKKL